MRKLEPRYEGRLEQARGICSGCKRRIQGVRHVVTQYNFNGTHEKECGRLVADTYALYNPLG